MKTKTERSNKPGEQSSARDSGGHGVAKAPPAYGVGSIDSAANSQPVQARSMEDTLTKAGRMTSIDLTKADMTLSDGPGEGAYMPPADFEKQLEEARRMEAQMLMGHELTHHIAQRDGGQTTPPDPNRETKTSSIPNELLPRPSTGGIQRSGDGQGSAGDVHAAAAQGIADSGATLPHLDVIQRAFGGHDVSGVKAHVGGAAARASAAIGADAYTKGDHVAFTNAPDLHTAAHEAAHVVQQRAGVQLPDGVGRAGDAYEQHADAVADEVVAGRSAEPLLDSASEPSPVQARADKGSSTQDSGTARDSGADGVSMAPAAYGVSSPDSQPVQAMTAEDLEGLGVRVHNDPAAAQVNAAAYSAAMNTPYFGNATEHKAQKDAEKNLIVHELGHKEQQGDFSNEYKAQEGTGKTLSVHQLGPMEQRGKK